MGTVGWHPQLHCAKDLPHCTLHCTAQWQRREVQQRSWEPREPPQCRPLYDNLGTSHSSRSSTPHCSGGNTVRYIHAHTLSCSKKKFGPPKKIFSPKKKKKKKKK